MSFIEFLLAFLNTLYLDILNPWIFLKIVIAQFVGGRRKAHSGTLFRLRANKYILLLSNKYILLLLITAVRLTEKQQIPIL